ncbi:UMP kinase [Candidatus Peregrinibacteria bacterium]|jgi:uridylate kinase|nr:UMP kinase [Candidatus Peregrinibacteria bacterium]MBT4055721.1 UMP kinase [Candidatus Peregrinibacteria bacterium]
MLTYKRILLKMSGEVFKGSKVSGIDFEVLLGLAKRVKKVKALGVEIGIVIGGGNIWRYRDNASKGGPSLDRVVSDNLGMMATNMNALAFVDALKAEGVDAVALTAYPCEKAMKTYVPAKAKKYLKKGTVVVFAGGTGDPYFTTDTAAAMRAVETNCDVVMKATKVDYVYDKDPVKYKDAKKYTHLTYAEVIDQKLGVMDMTCATTCKKGKLPMLVFNLNKVGLIEKAVKGEKVGTLITL